MDTILLFAFWLQINFYSFIEYRWSQIHQLLKEKRTGTKQWKRRKKRFYARHEINLMLRLHVAAQCESPHWINCQERTVQRTELWCWAKTLPQDIFDFSLNFNFPNIELVVSFEVVVVVVVVFSHRKNTNRKRIYGKNDLTLFYMPKSAPASSKQNDGQKTNHEIDCRLKHRIE